MKNVRKAKMSKRVTSRRAAMKRLFSWPPPPDRTITGKQISPEEELANRKMQIQINYHNEKEMDGNS